MAATIDTSDLRHRRGRRTLGLHREGLLYRLEPKIPIEAESLVADYISHGQFALAVCAPIERLQPLIQSLEAADVPVCSIVPAPLLALQGRPPKQTGAHNGSSQLIFVGASVGKSYVDLFRMEDDRPAAWRICEPTAAALLRETKLEAIRSAKETRLLDLCTGEPLATNGPTHAATRCDPEAINLAAARSAASVVEGRLLPWIELRRDALAAPHALRRIQRPLSFAIVALLLLLTTIAAAFWWRARHYDALTASHRTLQLAAYREVLPQGSEPIDLVSRLASEERRLKGLRGHDDGEAPPEQISALELLYRTLVSLPDDLRFRVTELRWESDKLYMEGQARSHADAEALAKALRQAARFTIEPPRSEQRPSGQGVTFTITGSAAAPIPADREVPR